MVEIKFIKTHPDAKLPTKAYDGDNCWDLYAVEETFIPCTEAKLKLDDHPDWAQVFVGTAVVPVGLSVGYITPGYGFVIRPRSGLGFKAGLTPHLGEIDNGYRGDLGVKLYNFGKDDYLVAKGDRIAQIKIEKIYDTQVSFIDSPVETQRGENKFGSSGN